MEKMTNKKALEFVLDLPQVKENVEICEKLQKMLIQVEKKNSATGKDGKKVLSVDQKKNEVYKEEIVEEMEGMESPMQIKEMLANFKCFQGKGFDFTPQKVSALMKQLVEEGKVVRVEDKRVTKFSLVPQEIEEEVQE